MKNIFIIFKKEAKDILRDKRTIIMMVVVPLLAFPIFINLTAKMTITQHRKAETRTLKVGIINQEKNPRFFKIVKNKNIELEKNLELDNMISKIKNKELDFGIVFSDKFNKDIEQDKSGEINLYFKSSQEIEIAKKRINSIISEYKQVLLTSRLHKYKLKRSIVDVIELKEKDLATTKEKIGEAVGGILPYIFIIFSFLGAMYPAIDLASGEKERGTIETLLVSPASRLEIILGKFFVVVLAGLMSAGISILGLYFSIKSMGELPEFILESLMKIIQFKSILLIFSLLIPATIFFAGLLLSLSVFAESYKEAQSIITPFNFFIIIPAFMGMLPGIELNSTTALIPILNVSLATKDIISGTINSFLLFEVYLSLIVLAIISIVFCVLWFNRESVIFRGI